MNKMKLHCSKIFLHQLHFFLIFLFSQRCPGRRQVSAKLLKIANILTNLQTFCLAGNQMGWQKEIENHVTPDVDRMASLDINVLIAKLVPLGAGEKKLYLSVGFYKTCIDPPRSAAKNDSINYYVGFYLGCVSQTSKLLYWWDLAFTWRDYGHWAGGGHGTSPKIFQGPMCRKKRLLRAKSAWETSFFCLEESKNHQELQIGRMEAKSAVKNA